MIKAKKSSSDSSGWKYLCIILEVNAWVTIKISAATVDLNSSSLEKTLFSTSSIVSPSVGAFLYCLVIFDFHKLGYLSWASCLVNHSYTPIFLSRKALSCIKGTLRTLIIWAVSQVLCVGEVYITSKTIVFIYFFAAWTCFLQYSLRGISLWPWYLHWTIIISFTMSEDIDFAHRVAYRNWSN